MKVEISRGSLLLYLRLPSPSSSLPSTFPFLPLIPPTGLECSSEQLAGVTMNCFWFRCRDTVAGNEGRRGGTYLWTEIERQKKSALKCWQIFAMHWPQNYLIKTSEKKKERERERGGKEKKTKDKTMYTEIFLNKKNCTKLKMKLGRHAANEISLRHCLIHSFRCGAICLFYVLWLLLLFETELLLLSEL